MRDIRKGLKQRLEAIATEKAWLLRRLGELGEKINTLELILANQPKWHNIRDSKGRFIKK